MVSTIIINKTKFFYYDTYKTWKNAYNIGIYYKRKNKSKYYIMKIESGYPYPRYRYRLYMTKVWRLFG